ncbi:MAG TPA: DUF885 domain-containing protein, partial [Anaerolineales bacterium]|nr:DUF885 domain-containing protein [Anaerolineales bacterium]
ELELGGYRLPLSKVWGFHLALPDCYLNMPFDTLEDYERYIGRLRDFPRYIQDQIELMRGALQRGFIPPRVILEGVDEAIRAQMVADPTQSVNYQPFLGFPAGFSETQRSRLGQAGQAAIQKAVIPGYQAALDFLLDEYLPAARDTIAASELPNGLEFYTHRIQFFTSLNLTPQEVHQIGLDEVKRIRAEMEAVQQKVGFTGNFRQFIEFLRSDARFYVQTPEQLLEKTALVLKRMDGELPQLFKTLPRLPYGIRAIPDFSAPGNTAAYYFPGPGDGSRAGVYYVNTYDLPSRPLYEIEALSLHEAVPGHHLQIALQQELENLPLFRRHNGFTSFVEGWALYAERLGLEVGFYQDAYSDFGRLSYEMWRACRLVVDTGMHALGWSREQAIETMLDNTSSTLLNIINEVDRYIAWPGQALAYKIGELKIRQLRAQAEAAMGDRFDLRSFHDVLLRQGAVPLDVLEAMVNEYIAAARR